MNTLRVNSYQSINQAYITLSPYLSFPKSIKYRSLVRHYKYLDLAQYGLLTILRVNAYQSINQSSLYHTISLLVFPKINH